MADQPLSLMAGIYNPEGDIKTCSMLTTEANTVMAEIHNIKKRMPVLLEENAIGDWFKNKNIKKFSKPQVELETKMISSNAAPRLF